MGYTQPPIDKHSKRKHATIAKQLGEIGFAMPGSLTERYTRCSSRGCHCHNDPPELHGPYWSWTRKIAGKTVQRMLKPHDVVHYREWFDNARALRELCRELEALTLTIATTNEGWGEK